MPFTLSDFCEYREEIRKSRFITFAAPISSPADAQAFLERHSDLNASHNCWAWKLGDQYCSNDDGEPGGTAGRPILQAIEGQDVDNVVVVVTRWFGGIKLGAGGLVRAYGGTAAECLRLAPRAPIVAMARLGLHCDFAELALLKARLKELQAEVEQETFGIDGVDLQLCLPDSRVAEAQARINDVSRGRSTARRIG
jgi:uncharacterized YigZ family protein